MNADNDDLETLFCLAPNKRQVPEEVEPGRPILCNMLWALGERDWHPQTAVYRTFATCPGCGYERTIFICVDCYDSLVKGSKNSRMTCTRCGFKAIYLVFFNTFERI
jgi:DNA-directed RNA polymerase subunit RPC12/RpoP